MGDWCLVKMRVKADKDEKMFVFDIFELAGVDTEVGLDSMVSGNARATKKQFTVPNRAAMA